MLKILFLKLFRIFESVAKLGQYKLNSNELQRLLVDYRGLLFLVANPPNCQQQLFDYCPDYVLYLVIFKRSK